MNFVACGRIVKTQWAKEPTFVYLCQWWVLDRREGVAHDGTWFVAVSLVFQSTGYLCLFWFRVCLYIGIKSLCLLKKKFAPQCLLNVFIYKIHLMKIKKYHKIHIQYHSWKDTSLRRKRTRILTQYTKKDSTAIQWV